MKKRTKNHRLRLALESWRFGQLLLPAPAKVGFNGERWDYGAIAGMPNVKGLIVDDWRGQLGFDKLQQFGKV